MKRVLSILLTLCLLTALIVPAFTAAETAAAGPVGGYRLTGIAAEEGSDLEIISKVIGFGVNLYLFLQEDGSGSIRIMEAEIPLSWEDGILIIPPLGKSETTIRLPFVCTDGGLKIQTSAFAMDFIRLTDAERKAYEENGGGNLLGIAGMLAMQLIDKLDTDLITSLLFSLAAGSIFDVEIEPVAEGEPSEGPVTGVISGMEYTVLGAEHVIDEMAGDVIVFYFDVKNLTDQIDGAWKQNKDAGQGGELLEQVFDLEGIPELQNLGLDFLPGRTLRGAVAYAFDPEGGTVGFRISDYGTEDAVYYYADPQNLTGAPAEDFVFDSDPSIPEEWKTLPEETGDVRLESVEMITDEDGNAAVRYVYRCLTVTDEIYPYYYYIPVQDGIVLARNFSDDIDNEEEYSFSRTCPLRTNSPVILVAFEAREDGTHVAVASKMVESDKVQE